MTVAAVLEDSARRLRLHADVAAQTGDWEHVHALLTAAHVIDKACARHEKQVQK